MQWILLFVGLEFPAVLALVDCWNRDPDDFAGGVDDRKAWLRWLGIGAATAWCLVGNGIILGYYYTVVRRNSPARR